MDETSTANHKPLFFFLPVYKPSGLTSHDVVAKMRRVLPKKTKVGHTGTLDPFAEGVLLLGIGKATRFSDAVHRLSKAYEATIKLGQGFDTLDPTGNLEETQPVPEFDDAQLSKVAQAFSGEIQQMPPRFSAKKVAGKRAYSLARAGSPFELEANDVTIHHLELLKSDVDTLQVRVLCSTGTYIRSLARDISQALGTVGHLNTLKRTSVGGVSEQHCLKLDTCDLPQIMDKGIDITGILPWIGRVEIPLDEGQPLLNGQAITLDVTTHREFIVRLMSQSQCQAEVYAEVKDQVIRPRIQCWRRP